MRTAAMLCLICVLCTAARAQDIIGRATVNGEVAFIRAQGRIVAMPKRGAVLEVLRRQGDRYWVRYGSVEGSVEASWVQFQAVEPPRVEPSQVGPAPRGEGRLIAVVEGNQFLRPLTNPAWKWGPVRITPADGPAAASAPAGPRQVLDVSVAADGSAAFLARLAPGGMAVFRSFDGGATFRRLGGAYWPVAVSWSKPSVMYGLAGAALYRSDDHGETWGQVCADLAIPEGPPGRGLDLEAAMPLAARMVAIQVDPFDSDRLLLGLRNAPSAAALASKATFGGGATGAAAPAEWRFSADGGKTWHHRLYRGSPADRLAEAAPTGLLAYRQEKMGEVAVAAPDVPRDAFLPMGALWFSPRARGVMYWADSQPPSGAEESARAAAAAWRQAGRSARQPWQGVMRSTDGGRTWRQIGSPALQAGPAAAEPASLPLARPGACRGRDALFAALTYADGRTQTRRLAFFRHDQGRWEGTDLFILRDPEIRLPEPLALLVEPNSERIYIPLDRPASSGRKAFGGGLSMPTTLGGVLYSPDGGESWRLYNADRADGEFFGPDRAGVLYVRQIAPGGSVLASTAPAAPPAGS